MAVIGYVPVFLDVIIGEKIAGAGSVATRGDALSSHERRGPAIGRTGQTVRHRLCRRHSGTAAPPRATGPVTKETPLRRIARLLIRIYQVTLSPLVGRQCRHLPTCSDYADQAIDRYGFWPGGWMALARILRCNPWGSSGYDPIPDALPKAAHWYAPWRYARWTGKHIDPKTRLDG